MEKGQIHYYSYSGGHFGTVPITTPGFKTTRVLTTTPGHRHEVQTVSQDEVQIRKTFPETWMFDTIDEELKYINRS